MIKPHSEIFSSKSCCSISEGQTEESENVERTQKCGCYIQISQFEDIKEHIRVLPVFKLKAAIEVDQYWIVFENKLIVVRGNFRVKNLPTGFWILTFNNNGARSKDRLVFVVRKINLFTRFSIIIFNIYNYI